MAQCLLFLGALQLAVAQDAVAAVPETQVQGNLELHPDTEAADNELERVSNVLSKDGEHALEGPITPSTDSCFRHGWGYDDAWHKDVNGGYVSNAQTCQATCDQMWFCDVFTYYSDTKACYLQGAACWDFACSCYWNMFNAFEPWGSWQFLDYVYVVVLVVWTWLQGLLIMKQSTVLKTMVSETTLITVTCVLDLCSKDTYNFGVRMGPSLMLVLIVYMSFVLYRTAEVYEDERKYHVKAVAPSVEESEEEIQEEMEEWWRCESPWWGCYDKKIKGAPILPAEEDEAGGSAMDTQMLVISLVYAVTDTSRTLLNSYALSSSQINPNSMSFLSFLVGLLFASAMTWRSHGLGCNGDEESQQKPTKGLLQAWNLRKIVDYGSSSLLQAVTMCLGNMAYAFGLSPPMAAVLGKVYTPVLAVGERVVLKKRRKGVEWIAVIILTLGTFSFLYLQIYDFEEGLGKAMKNLFPLILCIASACTSAFQALVSQGIYEANRDVDFYMNKVRFDAGSAAFTLLVVPLLSLTASRAKDIVWLPRTVDADCEVDHCWPKVTSLSNGGSLHFPWSMESSMLTCTGDVCKESWMFFCSKWFISTSVERCARMKSSAKSSAKAPKAPKAPTSSTRRRYLRQLDYLQSQFPLSLCLEGARQRLHSKDHYQHLQCAFSNGDVQKLQKCFAIVQNDPAFADCELVATAQKALRQVLHSRRVMKMGLECLRATPWEYPAEQVDFNVSVLRNSQLGPGIWDDTLLANAKLMKDADVLKLLRSVRPYNEDGSLKTRFDMERCTKAWLAQTEASLIAEDVSVKILLRLCECGSVGAPLVSALNEPFMLWRFASPARAAFRLEEIWKLLWTNGQINKATDLKVLPVTQKAPQNEASGAQEGCEGVDGPEMLFKGPQEVLQRARSILQNALGDAEIPCSETARTTRLTTVLHTVPGHTLLQLGRQGMLALTAKSMKQRGQSSLAALLQSCASTFGLQISWLSEADEGLPLLALCLKAAAAVKAAPKQFRYSRQEQSEMRMLISECASILESLEPGQPGQLVVFVHARAAF
eukprot:s4576_g2.t1